MFCAAVVVAAGAAAQAGLIDPLGTAASPFVGEWELGVRAWGLAVAATACAAATLAAPRLLDPALPRAAVDAVLYLATVGLGLAVNLVRDGTEGWTRMFDLGPPPATFEGPNEYLAGLPALQYGPRFFLDRFAELVPSLPAHVAGHPPGPLLVLHALGIDTAAGLTALCVLAGSVCAPLAHRLGAALHDEVSGRLAGLLVAASPLSLLFGVASYDWAFAGAATATATLLVLGGRGARAAGALALALTALLNWALLAVGAWAVLVIAGRQGARAAALVMCACGTALVAVNGVLAAAYGYDPIGTLRVTEQIYRDSIAQFRPSWYWAGGSVVAWGLTLGPAIAAGTLRGAVARRGPALALVSVVAVATLGGFTKAETERIWLFLVPLAAVAAAPHLPPARVRLLVGGLLVQALAMQVAMDTVW